MMEINKVTMMKRWCMAAGMAAALVSPFAVVADGRRSDFASPKGAVRENVSPFLWLHGTESEARMRDYVGRIDESGLGGLTIESRPHDGWMLDSWWRDVDIILDECRRRGMKMLVYDDYWLPSQGFGMMFPIPREFQCRDVKFASYDRASAPAKVENEIARVTAKEVSKGVYDIRPDGDRVLVYNWVVADPKNVRGLHLGRKIPLVNGLDPAAVDWFIEKFYKPYHDRYKADFENGTILGFFFDEPYTKGWWGPAMDAELAARGEDVGELLTAFCYRLSDPERQARAKYRFHDARAEAWGRTTYGRLSEWCERHGVYSTGHFMEHGWTHYDMSFSAGNVMQLLKYVTVPGIDLVCRQVYSNMRSRKNVSVDCGMMPKYSSSIAHVYNGYGGLNWCETFGAYGQNLAYPQMKWLCTWLQSQGCNFMVPHSFNMKAPLDTDCPPFFYNGGYEPRYPLFRVWADYSNRCSMMLSGGEHVCHVAQCMPGMSYHVGRTIRPEMFAFALQDAQLDCDFFLYDVVEGACIERNPRTGRPSLRAASGREHYDILVLPATEYVPYPVLEKALAFAKAGGVVVGYGMKPRNTPTRGRSAADVAKLVDGMFSCPTALFFDGEPDGPALRTALAKPYPGESRPLAVRSFDFDGLTSDDAYQLVVLHYEKDGERRLFIANQDDKRRRELKVRTVWPADAAERWDPMQGTVERPEVEGGLVKLALDPCESAFLVWPGKRAEDIPPRVDAPHGEIVDATVRETVTPVVVENGKEYREHMERMKPLEGAKWIWHPVDSEKAGRVTFRSHIDAQKAETARVIFACCAEATLFVNGARIARQFRGAEGFYYGWTVPVVADVALKAGRNEIVVEAENVVPTEGRQSRLAGFVASFAWTGGSLLTDDVRWDVSRKGQDAVKPLVVRNFGDKPWQKCMLGPMHSPYRESISTEIAFTLRRLKKGERVYLVCDGTAGENSAAIEVNGKFAGGFIGSPYRLDVTAHVREGKNLLVAKPFRLKNPSIVVVR